MQLLAEIVGGLLLAACTVRGMIAFYGDFFGSDRRRRSTSGEENGKE